MKRHHLALCISIPAVWSLLGSTVKAVDVFDMWVLQILPL